MKCLVARDELGRVEGRCLFAIYQWGNPQVSRSIEREAMRRGQNSPIDKLLKRPGPDPWIGKLKKSPSLLRKHGLYKGYSESRYHNNPVFKLWHEKPNTQGPVAG